MGLQLRKEWKAEIQQKIVPPVFILRLTRILASGVEKGYRFYQYLEWQLIVLLLFCYVLDFWFFVQILKVWTVKRHFMFYLLGINWVLCIFPAPRHSQ